MPKDFEYDMPIRYDAGRKDRRLAALSPDSVRIDERSEQELIAATVEHAKLINFYDETNTPNGTWTPFLLKDSRWAYAWILSSDYLSKKKRFYYIEKSARHKEPDALGDSINAAVELITEIMLDIDLWSQNKRSAFSVSDTRFDRYVEAALKGDLRHSFVRLSDTLSGIQIKNFEISRRAQDHIERCASLWSYRASGGRRLESRMAMTLLSGIFNEVYKTYVSIVELARTEYENVKYTGDVSPDVAMLTAFIRLYERQQKQINTLTRRHLDFQYRDVLGFSEKERTPDEVFVTFKLAVSARRGLVKKGTLLNAGKDADGGDVLFEIDGEMPVNRSRIGAAYTIFNGEKESSRSGLFLGEALGVSTIPEDLSVRFESWPVYGAPEVVEQTKYRSEKATLAWSLSSPALFLGGGNRSVTLVLRVDDQSADILEALQANREGKRFTGFEYSLSSLMGPLAVDAVESFSENSLTIEIELDKTAPEIVSEEAFSAAAEGNEYQGSAWPTLRMEVLREVFADVYPSLRDVRLLSVEFKVKVEELRKLQFHHDAAPAELAAPFPAFSGIPSLGSSLVVGSREAFSKPLERLSLNFEWDGLPAEGLSGHYSVYNDYFFAHLEPHNLHGDTFKATFAILRDGDWASLDGDKSRTLFNATDPSTVTQKEQVSNERRFEFDLLSSDTPDSAKAEFEGDLSLLEKPLTYGNDSNSGFMRVTLSDPEVAFGHSRFSQIVSFVSMENAKLAQEKSKRPLEWLLVVAVPFLIGWAVKLIGLTSIWPADAKWSPQDWATGIGALLFLILFCLKLFVWDKSKKRKPMQMPNPPVTPSVKNSSIGYQSRHYTSFEEESDCGAPLKIHHETAFSEYQAFDSERPEQRMRFEDFALGDKGDAEAGSVPCLPCFESKGSLYLKIDDNQEFDTLTFYLEILPAEADFSLDETVGLDFEYLSTEGWKSFRNNLLEDTTSGLMRSGLIRATLPADLDEGGGGMPSPGCWLALRSDATVDHCSRIRMIRLQGTLAKRVVGTASNAELNELLAADSVAELVDKNADIAAIAQPYASFGGRARESEAAFYTRVSERLRHKGRAVTSWDASHLILERFPSVYHVAIDEPEEGEEASDHDTLVVLIPQLDDETQPHSFHPRSSPVFLREVSDFIAARQSPFCRTKVVNPQFQEVKVRFEVVFEETSGLGRKVEELNKELRLFLSPWIRSDKEQIVLSTEIRRSDVVRFINNRPSVRLVLNFSFDAADEGAEVLWLQNATALFVSAKEHEIMPIAAAK